MRNKNLSKKLIVMFVFMLILFMSITIKANAATTDGYTLMTGSNFNGTIGSSVTEVYFVKTSDVPSGYSKTTLVGSDATQDIYTYTNSSYSGIIYIASDKTIYANENSSNMFKDLTSLTKVGFDNFDTSNVTNMSRMFYKCTNLTSIDVSNFDTSSVTNMSYMFYNCARLTNIDVSNFNTSKVTDMNSMFHTCLGLTNIDVSNFDTSKVTNMSYMFYYCSTLISLDLKNFDTKNVSNMSYMFYACSHVESLDLSGFYVSSSTNVTSMMEGMNGLKKVVLGDYWYDSTALSHVGSTSWYLEDGTEVSVSDIPSKIADDKEYVYYLSSSSVYTSISFSTTYMEMEVGDTDTLSVSMSPSRARESCTFSSSNENVMLTGEIIERYENDYPYPSCLIYGINLKNEIMHVVCGLSETELWIITAYYPDNTEWKNDLKTRKEIK